MRPVTTPLASTSPRPNTLSPTFRSAGAAFSCFCSVAEASRVRTELFLLDPSGPVSAASEADSGTKVTVDWQGCQAEWQER